MKKQSASKKNPITVPQKAQSAEEWDRVIRLAWRPVWSIRSRRGCLAVLKDKPGRPGKE
ncbi:MAG: hypothetical protein R3F53_04595 [Gammaproteobacteria bacterium]